MKQLSLILALVFLGTMSCQAAWSYRWGAWGNGYNPYGYMNAMRYLIPGGGYGNYGYYNNGYYNNYNNWNCGQWHRHHNYGHHHRRYWW